MLKCSVVDLFSPSDYRAFCHQFKGNLRDLLLSVYDDRLKLELMQDYHISVCIDGKSVAKNKLIKRLERGGLQRCIIRN